MLSSIFILYCIVVYCGICILYCNMINYVALRYEMLSNILCKYVLHYVLSHHIKLCYITVCNVKLYYCIFLFMSILYDMM